MANVRGLSQHVDVSDEFGATLEAVVRNGPDIRAVLHIISVETGNPNLLWIGGSEYQITPTIENLEVEIL